MIKKGLLPLVAFLISIGLHGQPVTDSAALPDMGTGLRVSLLTVGPGYGEIWEIFGHTGIRVIDSNEHGEMRDIVYNYGMFNGFDDNFEINFMRGKLLYFVAINLFPDFMEEYVETGRKVEEQVLALPQNDLVRIKGVLEHNALPENMYYKYDFFFDNCATRVRDIFPRSLGAGFAYSDVRPKGHKPTFRDIMNRYFYSKHWERVGVNILLGSRIDRVMTNADIMFLPDYLRNGLASAQIANKPAATAPTILLNGNPLPVAGTNYALLSGIVLLLLTIAGLFVKKLRLLGVVVGKALLCITGLLGCIILVMWFGTNHQGCSNNYNILWALPLNLFVAFRKPRGMGLYSLMAILLIMVSLLLHAVHIQGIVPEFVPLLLALLLVHGAAYKQSKKITPAK